MEPSERRPKQRGPQQTTRDDEGHIALPVSRAFLVQLAADCEPGGQVVRGRVEHVRSGEAMRFASLPELAAFMFDVCSRR